MKKKGTYLCVFLLLGNKNVRIGDVASMQKWKEEARV